MRERMSLSTSPTAPRTCWRSLPDHVWSRVLVYVRVRDVPGIAQTRLRTPEQWVETTARLLRVHSQTPQHTAESARAPHPSARCEAIRALSRSPSRATLVPRDVSVWLTDTHTEVRVAAVDFVDALSPRELASLALVCDQHLVRGGEPCARVREGLTRALVRCGRVGRAIALAHALACADALRAIVAAAPVDVLAREAVDVLALFDDERVTTCEHAVGMLDLFARLPPDVQRNASDALGVWITRRMASDGQSQAFTRAARARTQHVLPWELLVGAHAG